MCAIPCEICDKLARKYRLEKLRAERAEMIGAIYRAELLVDKAMCRIALADWEERIREELAELEAVLA